MLCPVSRARYDERVKNPSIWSGWLARCAILAGVALAMSACATFPPTGTSADVYDSPSAAPPPARWECTYAPTMNHDWHDDVICRKGSKAIRPHLRKGDHFVTQAEIMASARKYEAQLNSR